MTTMPEGAILTCRVEVMQYIHPETGALWWNIDHNDDATLTQIIGLLHTAAMEMYSRARDDGADA